MCRSIISLALLALVVAFPATASSRSSTSIGRRCGYFMTDEEKAEWSRLTSDAQAEVFVELFWAKHPNLKTVPTSSSRLRGASAATTVLVREGERRAGRRKHHRPQGPSLMGMPAGIEPMAAPSDDDRPGMMQRAQARCAPLRRMRSRSTDKNDYISFTFVETHPAPTTSRSIAWSARTRPP